MAKARISVSPEAAAWIVAQVEAGVGTFPDLVPGLSYAINFTMGVQGGAMIQSIGSPHFMVGWYATEQFAGREVLEVEVLGIKLLIEPSTLKELDGMRLVLETLERGSRKGSGGVDKALRRTPLDRGEHWPPNG